MGSSRGYPSTATMQLYKLESQVRRLGALALLITLSTILWGLFHRLRRPAGQTAGQPERIMNAPTYFGAYTLLCSCV